jgi:SAM-dependent methyltransferase
MPFAPLPAEFLKILDNISDSHAVVLDLGCGEGHFTQMVSRPGIHVFGLDMSLSGSPGLDLQGDALDPPVLPGSIDLLLAANLVRHLLRGDPEGTFLHKWQKLLKPGGVMVLFEDEPAESPKAVKNYHDVQLFLAQLVGPGRGPLLPWKKFQKIASGQPYPGSWKFGLEENGTVADPSRVLDFLAGTSGQVAPEVANLMAGIKMNGLAYGSYWWAQWRVTS